LFWLSFHLPSSLSTLISMPTTAATIWITAAIGMAAGMGREATALLATGFILTVLTVLRRLGRRIRAGREDGDDSVPGEGR